MKKNRFFNSLQGNACSQVTIGSDLELLNNGNSGLRLPQMDTAQRDTVPPILPQTASSACGITAGEGNMVFTAKEDSNAVSYEFFLSGVSQGRQDGNVITFSTAQTPSAVSVKYYYPLEFLKPKMILVEKGTFTIGAAVQDADAGDNVTADIENSITNSHLVTFTKDFKMSETPITQAQYEYVMGINPAHFQCSRNVDYFPSSAKPVEKVNWFDALIFCNRLSIMEGKTPCYSITRLYSAEELAALPYSSTEIPTFYGHGNNAEWNNNAVCDWTANGYRLPTEAEWEYAARGGNQSYSKLNSGQNDYYYSGGNKASDVAWCWTTIPSQSSGNAGYGTQTVKSSTKLPNALGLYEMSGNVFEWCWDLHGSCDSNAVADPVGASTGSGRVVRGGNWGSNAVNCRVSNCNYSNPYYRFIFYGFRVVVFAI